MNNAQLKRLGTWFAGGNINMATNSNNQIEIRLTDLSSSNPSEILGPRNQIKQFIRCF